MSETDNYWINFSFLPTVHGYGSEQGINMVISDPIIVNRDSSAPLLSKFINHKLNLMVDFYYLDDSVINSEESVIIIKYMEIDIE